MTALRVPLWNQLNDPNPDGSQDPEQESDCGEECASMVLFATTGVSTTEEQVREAMGKPGSGTSNNQDIAAFLSSHDCPAVALTPATGILKQLIRHEVGQNCPVIVLGAYVDPSIWHWVVAVDFGGGRVGINDPWGGMRRYVPWTWFLERYRGEAVRVDHTVDRVA